MLVPCEWIHSPCLVATEGAFCLPSAFWDDIPAALIMMLCLWSKAATMVSLATPRLSILLLGESGTSFDSVTQAPALRTQFSAK